MIRGTTPDYVLTLNTDLSGKTVYVTIAQVRHKITLTGDEISVASGETESTIAFRLTQQQTLGLAVGRAEIQVAVVNPDNSRMDTYIAQITVDRTLLDRVVGYND